MEAQDTNVFAGLEPRIITRWDVQKYARKAYDLGIRYIGGCCGFEPYHVRAIAEELAPERGFLPEASEKHGSWGNSLSMHTKPWVRARYVYLNWKAQQSNPCKGLCGSIKQTEFRDLSITLSFLHVNKFEELNLIWE